MPTSPQTGRQIRNTEDFPVPPLKKSYIDERMFNVCFDFDPETKDGTITQVVVAAVELVKNELYEVARPVQGLKRGTYLYVDRALSTKKRGRILLPCTGLLEFIISRTHVQCYYAVRTSHLADVAGVTELVLIDSYDRLAADAVREPVDAVIGAFPETENVRLNEALALLDAAGDDMDILRRRNKRRKGLQCFAVLRRIAEVRQQIDGIEVTMDHWLAVALGRFEEILAVYRSCHRVVDSRLSAEFNASRSTAYARELRDLILDFAHIHAHPFRRSVEHIIRDLETAAQAYEHGKHDQVTPYLTRVRNVCYFMIEVLPRLLALRLDLTRIVDLKEDVDYNERILLIRDAYETQRMVLAHPIDTSLDGVKIGERTIQGLEAAIDAILSDNFDGGRAAIEKILVAA